MSNLTIKLMDTEYPLATNLRVAYNVQNQHNHKSYTKLFSEIGDMTLEEQIDIIYASFSVANPAMAQTYSREMFRAALLDSDDFSAYQLMMLLQNVIAGILGKELNELSQEGATEASDGDAKN